MSVAAAVSNVMAVRDARDSDQRRASANVATVSVAAARTLARSRRAPVRVSAISSRMPTIVSTTINSGTVAPRRIVAFRKRQAHHTIPAGSPYHLITANDIV